MKHLFGVRGAGDACIKLPCTRLRRSTSTTSRMSTTTYGHAARRRFVLRGGRPGPSFKGELRAVRPGSAGTAARRLTRSARDRRGGGGRNITEEEVRNPVRQAKEGHQWGRRPRTQFRAFNDFSRSGGIAGWLGQASLRTDTLSATTDADDIVIVCTRRRSRSTGNPDLTSCRAEGGRPGAARPISARGRCIRDRGGPNEVARRDGRTSPRTNVGMMSPLPPLIAEQTLGSFDQRRIVVAMARAPRTAEGRGVR